MDFIFSGPLKLVFTIIDIATLQGCCGGDKTPPPTTAKLKLRLQLQQFLLKISLKEDGASPWMSANPTYRAMPFP